MKKKQNRATAKQGERKRINLRKKKINLSYSAHQNAFQRLPWYLF
jgi:hypothetical protein